MPVIDASVWVAYYHQGDRFHEQCLAWVGSALDSGERLSGPTLLVAEVAAAIARLSHSEAALKAIEQLTSEMGLELFALDEARALRAAEVAATTGVRGADAVYLALAAERGDVLITLDREQRDRGRNIAKVQQP